MSKFLDYTGLGYFYAKMKERLKKKVDKEDGKGLSSNDYTTAEKEKLARIATGANKYVHPAGDGNLHLPATGTTNSGKVLKAGATAGSASWGTLGKTDVGLGNVDNTSDANKPISTATQTALNAKVPTTRKINNKALSADITLTAADVSAIPAIQKGANSGVAELDATGKVPAAQLPSYVDDVLEGYLSGGKFYREEAHTTEITGETGKIYVDLATSKTYRWSGSAFAVISDTIALGETAATAYRGDRGKIAYDHSQTAHAPSNANYYVHPSTSGNKHIPAGGEAGKYLKWAGDGTAMWGNETTIEYSGSLDTLFQAGRYYGTNKVTGIPKNIYLFRFYLEVRPVGMNDYIQHLIGWDGSMATNECYQYIRFSNGKIWADWTKFV